jgi:parallel beta-helix repeat protein
MPGTYTENIDVTIHNIIIKSESGNPTDTIITAKDPNTDVFSVESNRVTISGFKILEAKKGHSGIYMYQCKNCTIENNRLLNNTYGIYLKNSDYNMILNNLIGKGDKGIVSEQSTYNTISGNRASKNRYGLEDSNSEGNLISNNTLSENNEYGISISTDVDTTLSGNNASSNGRGIHLGNSDSNKILDNTIVSNKVYGLFICPKSDKNSVLNNYFNNNVNAIPNNGTGNIYNIEKTAGTNIVGGPYLAGNYWASPNGTGFSQTANDTDGDGIADDVYRINSEYVDQLPLVIAKVKDPILPVANFSTNTTSGHPPLSVQFTDLSENETNRSWDFEHDGNIDSTDKNPVHAYVTPGLYNVTLTASNENGTASKNLTITVIEGRETEDTGQNIITKQKIITSLPGFELITGIFGLLAVYLYRKR